MKAPHPKAYPGPVLGMGNIGSRYQQYVEVQGSKSIPGGVDITANGVHWERTPSDPTATRHLPGHSADSANEAVPSGGGNANEGPFPVGLPRCHGSCKGRTTELELHWSRFYEFGDQ